MSKSLAVLLELKDCSDSWCEYYVPLGIHARIDEAIAELLAQPEPVAWKETLIEHFQSAFDSEMYRTDEGEELILLEDAICYVEEFAPPKREPLSEEAVGELLMRGFSTHLIDLVRMVEKAHGIGGEE